MLSATESTEFIDLELGLYRECECDWGLFIILDEDENIPTRQLTRHQARQDMLKYITQIETIQEGNEYDEYEFEETYGNGNGKKMEYYTRPTPHTKDATIEEVMEPDQDQDEEDTNDAKNLIKIKMNFLITYALTTSFSIVLIILTFA